VKAIFNDNYQAYGTRRLQAELRQQDIILSRRRIGRIMQKNGLVSKYTCKKYRANTEQSNKSTVSNQLNREFTVGQQREVLENIKMLNWLWMLSAKSLLT
jgi:putative transposase